MARKHKRSVGGSWRMDETYTKVKGAWKYLYRAVDRQGKIVDFLLTAKRDMAAAKRFFDKAMGENGDPDKVAMDKNGANKAAIDAINAGRAVPILLRQVKYFNKALLHKSAEFVIPQTPVGIMASSPPQSWVRPTW